MNKTITIALVGIVLLVGGGMLVMSQQSQNDAKKQEQAAMEKQNTDDSMMKKTEANPQSSEDNAMMKKDEGSMMGYSGTVIAGKTSPYIEFNQADYEKAMQSGKIIFLEFYANWCPICRAQAPKLAEGFDALNDANVVGFRVNYNDSDTDEAEKKLAKDFGVTYQHTHVIVKDGKAVSKTNDNLDKDSFVSLIDSVK